MTEAHGIYRYETSGKTLEKPEHWIVFKGEVISFTDQCDFVLYFVTSGHA